MMFNTEWIHTTACGWCGQGKDSSRVSASACPLFIRTV